MLRVDFVTLFPEMVMHAVSDSIMARAVKSGAVKFGTSNPREFTVDAHRSVDDTSYGGGPGMVMMAPPIAAALDALSPSPEAEIVLCDPSGDRFGQDAAHRLSTKPHVVFVCGHYGGVDERVRTKLATCAYSIGDYVVTGGELPALVMADAVVRLLPGVLGDPASCKADSHSEGLLGYPLFTRPEQFMGETVPDVLRSGNHAEIERWRRKQRVQRTRSSRPDLFCRAGLSLADLDLI